MFDTDPRVADRCGLLDVKFLTGSGTSSSLLERARVSTCDLLIACTGLDEVNIVACSIGSQLGCRRTICFVSKEDFVHTPEGRESLSEHFGIDQVVWPEAQLADAIERIIMALGSMNAGVFAGGEIRLLEFRLGFDSPPVGRPMANYGHLHPLSKLVLTGAMWIGRLEILTVLAPLRPKVWRSADWRPPARA